MNNLSNQTTSPPVGDAGAHEGQLDCSAAHFEAQSKWIQERWSEKLLEIFESVFLDDSPESVGIE